MAMPHATSYQGVSVPRILFIDAYDSFTNNVVSLLETQLGVEVTVIHIDDEIADFPTFLKPFAAVVAGPGPGDPRNPEDVGLIGDVWKLDTSTTLLPVLGICLGFQSLVLHFGGSVGRLPEPRHGIVRKVRSKCKSIFRDHEYVETVVYHSLQASLHPSTLLATDDKTWRPSSNCPDLRPLAYDYEIDQRKPDTSAAGEAYCLGAEGRGCNAYGCATCNARIPIGEASSSSLPNPGDQCSPPPTLMAVEHLSKPFVGLQFHPESICSSKNARAIIASWWNDAMQWNTRYRHRFMIPASLPLGKPAKHLTMWNEMDRRSDFHHVPPLRNETPSSYHGRPKLQVHARVIDTEALSVSSICEVLDLTKGNAIILDSEMHQMHDVGQYSIIGITTPDTVRIEYRVGVPRVHLTSDRKDSDEVISLEDSGFRGSVFSYLKAFMRLRKAETDHAKVPFSGGLIGYVSYEACIETNSIHKSSTGSFPKSSSQRPDLSFAFVERSIVIDHFQQTVHVQSIKANDGEWVDDTATRLQHSGCSMQARHQPNLPHFEAYIILPDEEIYKSQVRTCQSSIRAGDSYELCLTTEATIRTSTPLPSWPLYQRLRTMNPSPFSAYMRLGKLTLLCSSPERFLRWSRPASHKKDSNSNGFVSGQKTSICQLRPIKGTVRRQPNPNFPPLNIAEATALLSTPKERAENLMIVDLIRHDLHGSVGSGRVNVPKLMVVEEYATLFQLVSVVEGSLLIEDEHNNTSANYFSQDRALDKVVAIQEGAYKGRRGPVKDTTSPEARVDSHTIKKIITAPKDELKCPRQTPTKRHHPPQDPTSKTGIDVLASSLPPGSMTGAPKLRSCQILDSIEHRNRGIYSGIIGYLDVGGGGDFNVVIRSAFRWDDDRDSPDADDEKNVDIDIDDAEMKDGKGCGEGKEGEKGRGDMWTIGAGGAVTILSTEEGEWEEMSAKLRSTLRLFEAETGTEAGDEGIGATVSASCSGC